MSVQLSVIIPVFNEEVILRENLQILGRELNNNFGRGFWKFIIVDNGSTDRTSEILKEELHKYPESKRIYEKIPNYGNALRAGLSACDTHYAHLIDIEQYDIPFLRWAWKNIDNFDILIGSKRSNWTIQERFFYRRFLSWGLNGLLQIFFDFMGTETHGPKLINMVRIKNVINACVCDRGQFDTEIVLRSLRAGFRIAEAPIAFKEQRPARNLMLKKILWNLLAFNRLRIEIKKVPVGANIYYNQFSRSDVLNGATLHIPKTKSKQSNKSAREQ